MSTIQSSAVKRRSVQAWFASGEPWIWLNAAAVGISVAAVVCLLGLIAVKGLAHFWPADVQLLDVRQADGSSRSYFGELIERDRIPVQQYLEAGGEPQSVVDDAGVLRWLVKTGNRRSAPPDFRWLFESSIVNRNTPAGVAVIERLEWGNAYGRPIRFTQATGVTVSGDAVWPALLDALREAAGVRAEARAIEQGDINRINHRLEQLRLTNRRLDLRQEPADSATRRDNALRAAELRADYEQQERRLRVLNQALAHQTLVLSTAAGSELEVPLAQILAAHRPNDMSVTAKLTHYLRNIWRFLSEDPREANTEGGIYPAIFGTVLMVMLMAVVVTPFGVIAAIYLREYARQGPVVRTIRIAVNNLAGVPSIVYGVFGLGFFVYFLGGSIDELFFRAALPSPTLGTPGLLWASLTLALLTLPVVIVSTEEGLTRIPRALREGSLALGATKAETLFRVVLPMASPSILTGIILAVARAAGEVAPLMLVGVVKLAPTLPLDGNFPYLHLERKFMHLGFHVYDVGFQSPNVEAARPLVYATALLLVLIIVFLNLTAIMLRSRLERRYRGMDN